MSRTRMGTFAPMLALALFLGACGSCRSCAPKAMAEIVAARGTVLASRASSPNAFASAPVGTTFELGDAIRTQRASTAKLALDDGSELAVRPSTTIRFSATRPGRRAHRFDVVEGEAVLTAASDTVLETDRGSVRARAGSSIRLARESGELVLVVTVGAARLELDGEAPRELGTNARVALGAATDSSAPDSDVAAAADVHGPATVSGSVTATTTGEHEVASGSGWIALAPGAHDLPPGTRIRQLEGGSIALARGSDRLVVRGAAVLTVGQGHELVSRLEGSPTLESSTDGVAVVTAGGVLVLRPSGARTVARLGRDEHERETLRVDEGAVDVRAGGGTTRVSAGETHVFEPDDSVVPLDAPNLRASRIDLPIEAGEGIVIRDPSPPTAIGIATSGLCPGEAIVEVLEGATTIGIARGTGTIPVAFREGSPSYRVRCVTDGAVGRPVARGRIRILRTTGQAPLPRNAPESAIEADGRTYQIVFSNRLPAISVRWPSGPDGPATLVVAGGRTVNVAGPRYRFPSGALGEGTHRLHFESGGRRSRDTTVVVRFDPVAASASLESPADGSFAPGERVRVSGSVLPGFSVSAAGQSIPVAPDQRFSGEVVAPTSGALVIRFVRAGQTHLYLRRPRGAAP